MNELRNIEGVVSRTNERQVNTARGLATSYSALLETGNGEEWFSFGFKRPPLEAGQQIRFVAKARTFKNRAGQEQTAWDADPNSLEVLKTAPAPKAAAAKSGGGGMKSAVAAADNRQRSIVLQTAYKVAPTIVLGAIEQSLVSLPAKKADKFDAYMHLINETAMRLAAAFINPPEEFLTSDEIEAEDASDEDYDDEDYTPV